jgi:hypothetical protein
MLDLLSNLPLPEEGMGTSGKLQNRKLSTSFPGGNIESLTIPNHPFLLSLSLSLFYASED